MLRCQEKEWVLIVEDEERIVKSISKVLEKMDYFTQDCKNTLDARFKLSNQKFKCIILDMHLERGNGSEIIKEIKGNKHHTNYFTPIVVVSGNLNLETIKEVRRLVQGAIVKPFKSEQLKSAVVDAIIEARKIELEDEKRKSS